MKIRFFVRKILWTEKTDCLKLIQLGLEDIFPLELSQLTNPPEREVGVLMSQFRAVVQREITMARNPLLYHIAVSHVKSLVTQEHADDSQELSAFKTFVLKEFRNSQQIKELFDGY